MLVIGRLDTAFCSVNWGLDWLGDFLNNMSEGMATIALKRLPPTLFPTLQFMNLLCEIKKALLQGWSLTPSLQSGDPWKAYQEATVYAAVIVKGTEYLFTSQFLGFP